MTFSNWKISIYYVEHFKVLFMSKIFTVSCQVLIVWLHRIHWMTHHWFSFPPCFSSEFYVNIVSPRVGVKRWNRTKLLTGCNQADHGRVVSVATWISIENCPPASDWIVMFCDGDYETMRTGSNKDGVGRFDSLCHNLENWSKLAIWRVAYVPWILVSLMATRHGYML